MRNLVTPVGRFVFGSILSPRVNPNNDSLEYTAGFVLSVEDSQSLLENMEQALVEHRAKNPNFPDTNDKLNFPYEVSRKLLESGEKVEDPDNLLWKFKNKAQYKSKQTGEMINKTPPSIYDSLGRIITNKLDRIPGGTTGKIVYDVWVYDQKVAKGVQLQIKGFQIASMVQEHLELQPIEGGWVAEEDDIDAIGAALAANA